MNARNTVKTKLSKLIDLQVPGVELDGADAQEEQQRQVGDHVDQGVVAQRYQAH